MKIILASASPRRQMLLAMAGFVFEVLPSCWEETVDSTLPPDAIVAALARQKTQNVLGRAGNAVVIGADTIVVQDGCVLGKPQDKAEAVKMLRFLQNSTHTVYTGLCVATPQKELTRAVSTVVRFGPMTDAEIIAYVESGEPMDKAGAYGIQGKGGLYIESICGCYYNVMRLPLYVLKQMLDELEVSYGMD